MNSYNILKQRVGIYTNIWDSIKLELMMKSTILMELLLCSIALITADNANRNELIQQVNAGDAAAAQYNLGLKYNNGEGIKQN